MLDDHAAHSAVNGLEGIGQFRDHAVCDDSFCLQCCEFLFVDLWDDAVVVIFVEKNSVLFKTVDELDFMSQFAIIAAMGTVLACRAHFPAVTVFVTCKGYGY